MESWSVLEASSRASLSSMLGYFLCKLEIVSEEMTWFPTPATRTRSLGGVERMRRLLGLIAGHEVTSQLLGTESRGSIGASHKVVPLESSSQCVDFIRDCLQQRIGRTAFWFRVATAKWLEPPRMAWQ